jgi:hypothetical protein
MPDEHTYQRLLDWAERLTAEGSDWGPDLAAYGRAWQAEVEQLRACTLTPAELRGLADFIFEHGHVTTAEGLTFMLLNDMAEAAEAANEKGGG